MKRPALFLIVMLAAGCSLFQEETSEQSPRPVRIGEAPVDGAKLYYEEAGEGLPVVLIHGGLLDRRMWDDQFQAFARRHRVIRYDVRGYGRSGASMVAYTDHDDLRLLLDHLQIDRAVILGLSMGGRIAVDFAAVHPDRVSALVPAAPGLSGYTFPDMADNKDYAAMMEAFEREDFGEATEYFQRMWTDGPKRTPDQVDPVMRGKIRSMALSSLEVQKKHSGLHFPDPPAAERLSKIRTPTLVVLGDLDMPDITAIADLLVKEIPGARKVVIPGAAHMVNMEKPAEFNRIVLDFLSGLELNTGG